MKYAFLTFVKCNILFRVALIWRLLMLLWGRIICKWIVDWKLIVGKNLGWPSSQPKFYSTQFTFGVHNSLSAAIHLYMIRTSITRIMSSLCSNITLVGNYHLINVVLLIVGYLNWTFLCETNAKCMMRGIQKTETLLID